ncbi:membrane protein [Streptomyces platensis subsp. clarensis]|nr:membrane protein [Streptomyces platensis subsp. clarensis]
MSPDHTHGVPIQRALEVHQSTPLPPAVTVPASVVSVQPGSVPAVASIVLPDGRVVTGYAIESTRPEPVAVKPAVSRTAVNVALGGVGFLAVCGGLILLTSFIAALTAFIAQLIILAAVIFGGWIAVQVFSASSHQGRTTVNIRKAVLKRNHFHT